MTKAESSGIHLTNKEAGMVLAMVARGDREHDVAAWFGVNQGRIKEVKDGSHGSPPLAKVDELPPRGSPGPKARRLIAIVEKAQEILQKNGTAGVSDALIWLEKARESYYRAE